MPDQDYAQFAQDAQAAGAPIFTVNVPDYGIVHFFEKARPGPMLSYAGKALRCERTFVVWPYADAWGFSAWNVGWSYLKTADEAGEVGNSDDPGDYEGAGVYRRLPQPLPMVNKRTRKPLAYATEVSRFIGLRPAGNSNFDDTLDGSVLPVGDFYAAEVTIVYGSLPYRLLTDEALSNEVTTADLATFPQPLDDLPPREYSLRRYVNRVGAPSAKHVQFPSGVLKWEGVGLPKNFTYPDGTSSGAVEVKLRATQTAGRMIPYTDVVYTWYQVPGIPKAVFTGAIGKVNRFAFDDFDPETLLLTAVELTPHRMITGERAFDIAYRMRHLDGNEPEEFDDGDVPLDGSYAFADSGHNYFLRYQKTGSGNDEGVRFVWDRPFSGPDSGAGKKWVFDSMNYEDLFKGPFTTGLWVAT